MNEQTRDRLLLTLAAVVWSMAQEADLPENDRREMNALWDAMQDGTDEYVQKYDEEVYKRLC